jgi:hypothetical protein
MKVENADQKAEERPLQNRRVPKYCGSILITEAQKTLRQNRWTSD